MRHGIAIAAFTDRGMALAETLVELLDASAARVSNLSAWTAEKFPAREALIFVGAAGIAVRAVAPHLKSKADDPAVVVVDETGRFVIPLVSGHLGGANALSKRIADHLHATAIITTATDLNGVFAVDLWAKRQGLTVRQPERIKTVSSRLLAGGSIRISCPWPIKGEAPDGVCQAADGEVIVDVYAKERDALQLVPRALTLGIGCRRGTSEEQIEAVFQHFCKARGVLPDAICAAASIDLKRDEAGLLTFCQKQGWLVRFFPAAALESVAGSFTASDFVRQTVGVDNVCERSAVLGAEGVLLEKKYASDGVTLALALTPPQLDWRW
ncbi:MAG: cobalamin biosynthesis protein [Oscillospiraceae bacterium]|nr:cobalamin biosynthesis protein [Oscillospiraceae bacterium]